MTKNKIDKQYQDLLQDILDNGNLKGDRTGTGTISVFGRQIRHDMKDGFPLLTTKKMPFKSIVTELIWFLKGDTNIKFLVDNKCNIWNGDAYKNYSNKSKTIEVFNEDGTMTATSPASHYDFLTMEQFIEKIKTDDEFAKKWGELGPIYGRQWRNWDKFVCDDYDRKNKSSFKVETIEVIDQIANLINELRDNPDSRRLLVNAWNVADINDMVLPPCHYGFQFYTVELSYKERYDLWFSNNYETGMEKNYDIIPDFTNLYYEPTPERKISLMWNQRSVDTFLGLPFNIASYALLLEIIAKEVNMVPDQLIGNLGDVHLYLNHIEQAKEQIGREYTNEEILVHMNESGMDALKYEPRMRYMSNLPKRTREPFDLPKIKVYDTWKYLSSSPIFADKLKLDMFELVDYKSHGEIKAPLSN